MNGDETKAVYKWMPYNQLQYTLQINPSVENETTVC